MNESVPTTTFYWLVRLTGRCANGAERDGGRRVHVVPTQWPVESGPAWGRALCGLRPGRLSNGFVEVEAEAATCPTCARRARRIAEAKS
jgi:hypothetical protein